MPGEIGGDASHPENSVDYPRLFDHFISGKNFSGLPHISSVSTLARSTHSFPHVYDMSPKERFERSVKSFKDVLHGKPDNFIRNLSLEFHQFGVIGSLIQEKGNFSGSREVSWHFQVMFRSKASGYMDKCWSWDKSEKIQTGHNKEVHFLNGIGWLYSVLDHLQGDETYLLDTKLKKDSGCNVTSVAFTNNDRITLILSSWTKDREINQNISARINIPESILPFKINIGQAKMICSADEDEVYKIIKKDLNDANNLKFKFKFKENDREVGTIRSMAADYDAASKMIFTQMAKYQNLQQKSLSLKEVPEGKLSIQMNPGKGETEVSADLLPDEICVFIFKQ